MRFTKMHGIGNDYLYIDGFQETVKDPEALARQMSDRHFGVGSDGLILILPSAQADFRMRMFNADGSEAEMCGNGIRCLAKYVYDHGLTRKDAITVETLAGTLPLELTVQGGKVARVRVDMGRPRLERGEIPMLGVPGRVVNEPLAVGDRSFQVTAVSMGNPHCVSFVPDVAAFPVATYGPLIERHPAFPRRTNAEFVEVLGPGELRIRTWERGAGETLACATGASATVVAAALTGRAARRAVAHLLGGDLEIEWAADDHVYMTGPAVEVFQGEWPEG
ncbi:MAG: diaminopimelate epimerase [Deltaproteobacteria bacterium]|nr:diaminopimelate epimerase [Deltaproteobacteria bacterium]